MKPGPCPYTAEDQFIRNKYYRWYQRLCSGWSCTKDRAEDYIEKHHILPKAMGGKNNEGNIVKLSFRKHFLAHWLLTRCTQGSARLRMLAALNGMKRKGKCRVVSGWQFSVARLALGRFMKSRYQDESFMARHIERSSMRMKKRFLDQDFVDGHVERSRARMKKHNDDPAFRAARMDGLKRMCDNTDFRIEQSERMSKTMRKLNQDLCFKARTSERARKRNANPIFQAKAQAAKRMELV